MVKDLNMMTGFKFLPPVSFRVKCASFGECGVVVVGSMLGLMWLGAVAMAALVEFPLSLYHLLHKDLNQSHLSEL
jgi:hypothetical protein